MDIYEQAASGLLDFEIDFELVDVVWDALVLQEPGEPFHVVVERLKVFVASDVRLANVNVGQRPKSWV